MTNKGMTRFETIRTLRKHVRLSERRSEVWKQNKVAKALIYFSGVVTVLYLIFFAVMISLIANSSETRTPYEIIFGLLPFLMAVDFGVRLMAQQTPSQLIKPYILLPIPKMTCIDSFMVSSLTNGGNLIWMGLFLPYTIMSVVFAMGFWKAVVFLLALYLIILIWSQWYMLGRSLVNRSYLWWIVPGVVFALLFSPWYIGKNASITTLCDTYANIGLWLERYPLLVLASLVAILALLIAVNRRLQFRFVYAELAKVTQTHLKHVTEIKSLDRFGEVGEYIKLEIKSIMRNKNMRGSFLYGVIFTIILSIIISYTDIYDDAFSSKFFMVYVFIISGAMLLVKVMGAEGNYIDGLMIHKENILQLLHAKYYFYMALLILPFIIMLPTVFMGKYTLLQLFATMIFAAGPVYCVFMQMAVWNKQTIPLNSKLVSKGNVETNWFAVIAEMAAMFMPVVIISVLSIFFSQTITFIIMLIIGLAFIAASPYWMRNIYNRFMRVRYTNMEIFRATR